MPAVVAGALVSAIGITGIAGTVATALVGAGASFALQSLSAKPVKPKTVLDAGKRIEMVRDVIPEVATTPGDPAGSPTWSGWSKFAVADVTARGIKFRARLVTTNAMATPAIEQLKVSVTMPDRIAAGADVVSSAGGTAITFAPAFKTTPSITITPHNLATGDFWTVTAKSRTGFTVQFKNSAGTGISRTFDWTARGYGREQ